MADASADSVDALLTAVRFYRRLGFFGQWSHMADEDLAEQLNTAYLTMTRSHDLRWLPLSDLDPPLLHLDVERVWWESHTDDDVCPGQDAYVRILREWSRISRGAFTPSSIAEDWRLAEEVLVISFDLNGTRRSIHTDSIPYGWVDVALVGQINPLIAHTGLQFTTLVTHEEEDSGFLVVLTKDERAQIALARPWAVDPNNSYV